MEQRNPRLRWLVVWVLAVVWIAVVIGRLSYLQLFSYGEYLAKAQRQQQRIFEISPMRGPIYDRKGRELAVSLPLDSVFGDPAEIADVDAVSGLLSRVLDVSPDDLADKLRLLFLQETDISVGFKLLNIGLDLGQVCGILLDARFKERHSLVLI